MAVGIRSINVEDRTRAAEVAIRDGRAGRISVPQMLRLLGAAQVLVPLADPPVMNDASVVRWKPATITKKTDGSQFVLAFTSKALIDAFSKGDPAHSFAFLVEVAWLLNVLPQAHGLVFNLGGTNGFEWPASGIAAYNLNHDASYLAFERTRRE
jgi:hypothetical protein